MKVATDISTWQELFDFCWPEARNILREIEEQGLKEEALGFLRRIFNPVVWGHIPTEKEVNRYIWFKLPYIMHLHDKPNTRA